MKHALILGAGFSGKVIGQKLSKNGWTVSGTTRNPNSFNELRDCGIEPILFDGEQVGSEFKRALQTATHIIVSIAPPRTTTGSEHSTHTDPFLNVVSNPDFSQLVPNLSWIGYLSTVGVYGNHDGAWIDETTPAAPVSERSKQRVAAENEWLSFSLAHGMPLTIFRLSGIYGPGRNALKTARDGKSRRLVKPGQVFNRIHVSDIARAVSLAAEGCVNDIFNITDDLPCPPQDVVTFAHTLMGSEPPAPLDFETADISPMARSFYGENKRVSNQKSKDVLGMDYQWPNYQIALQRMWDENNWESQPKS